MFLQIARLLIIFINRSIMGILKFFKLRILFIFNLVQNESSKTPLSIPKVLLNNFSLQLFLIMLNQVTMNFFLRII